jgi:NADH dehydrogenase
MKNYNNKIKIDFSLKREVFFVVVGAIIGAIIFVIPKTIFDVAMGMPYYLSWLVFGHVIGVYSSSTVIIAGIGIHMVTAISIGVVIGIFLYKTGILNISKPSNGIIYGIFAGTVVFIIFFIPVYQFVLTPETVNTLQEFSDDEKELYEYSELLSSEFLTVLISSLITHLIFGITVGLVSSLLSIKFGTRYRCPICYISFGRIDSYQKHIELVHGTKPIDLKRILILGGGFAGIKILQQLQKEFQDNIDIDITIVSRDNFFLFTPMLPEVAASAIETRHILTPIRSFCKRARFYEANIDSINLEAKEVAIRYNIGKYSNTLNDKIKVLKYDYLILALGGETNFFGIESASKNAFTMKTIGDALLLRNHVINMLEQADMEYENIVLQKSFMTFVVVGGGFSGVETVGELNDFVRDSVKQFYHNIDIKYVKVILVNSGPRVLPEVSDDLSEYTLTKLEKNGVQIILNNRVKEIGLDYVLLNTEEKIPSYTVVWAGGVKPSKVIIGLNCEHDKSGKIITNENLKVNGYKSIFALGDCAFIVDPNSGKPYPPTAQHALREARIVSNNIINEIYSNKKKKKEELVFNYKTKGMMALIGKRNGVGIVFGRKIQGFIGWIFWRLYYLGNLPTTEKKFRVMLDWFIDLFFKRDITRLKTLTEKAEEK